MRLSSAACSPAPATPVSTPRPNRRSTNCRRPSWPTRRSAARTRSSSVPTAATAAPVDTFLGLPMKIRYICIGFMMALDCPRHRAADVRTLATGVFEANVASLAASRACTSEYVLVRPVRYSSPTRLRRYSGRPLNSRVRPTALDIRCTREASSETRNRPASTTTCGPVTAVRPPMSGLASASVRRYKLITAISTCSPPLRAVEERREASARARTPTPAVSEEVFSDSKG